MWIIKFQYFLYLSKLVIINYTPKTPDNYIYIIDNYIIVVPSSLRKSARNVCPVVCRISQNFLYPSGPLIMTNSRILETFSSWDFAFYNKCVYLWKKFDYFAFELHPFWKIRFEVDDVLHCFKITSKLYSCEFEELYSQTCI